MKPRASRVAVLYNAPVLPAGHPDGVSEADVLAVADAVAVALGEFGWEPVMVSAAPPVEGVLRSLGEASPDVVFNLIEGFGGLSAGATWITALLELAGMAITGSPSECLALCQSKGRTKALLRGFGLPTAPFHLIGPDDPVSGWDWDGPALVKPDAEDGSLGIDQASVVETVTALRDRVAALRAAYSGSVLVEAYLPGPEFNMGVLESTGLEPLPAAEIVYERAAGSWPILTYAAKWATGSPEDLATRPRCPAEIDARLADRLAKLAVAACRATACRDYARVDFRLDARGEPMILEVNPNPDIGPSAGWARALRASGRDYGETLDVLARNAWDRSKVMCC